MLKSEKMRKATWQQVPKHISNLYTSLHPPYTLFGIWNHHLIPGLLRLWSPNWCLLLHSRTWVNLHISSRVIISKCKPDHTTKTLHNLILAISFMLHDTHTLLTFYSSDMPIHIFYPKICPLPLSFTWKRLQLTALNPCSTPHPISFCIDIPSPERYSEIPPL